MSRGSFSQYFCISAASRVALKDWTQTYTLLSPRRDLFVANPAEASVTRIARRYGFDHLGRFAVDYRSVFGESPSDTLRC